MPMRAPNLDDRTFSQLVAEAKLRVAQSCPAWTDLSAGDPGMTLLEAFAYLTEQMIYRLNRLPEKAYLEFLRLIGVKVQPPTAAGANLRFSVDAPAAKAIEIPRGTRVTLKRTGPGGEAPVFVTSKTVTIRPGETSVDAPASHAEYVAGELAGRGTGLPGLSVTARRAPIVAPMGNELDLVVAVEAAPGELDERVRALEFQGKPYRVWREVESFTDLGSDRFVYTVDRLTGTITFAAAVAMRKDGDGPLGDRPEALAAVPAADREIRLWYGRGGGPEGNVAEGTLDTLKDPIPPVKVTNLKRATGGRAAETLENAMLRGPQELHSLRRAVTGSDFEHLAKNSGAVDRARAFTKAALWKHAPPGTVEVLLVPDVHGAGDGSVGVTEEKLREHQTENARQQIQKVLDERRPLGTSCQVNWVRYKTVRAEARVVVHREEDPKAVENRLLRRLNQIINPLSTPLRPSGWPFGEPIRAFNVYETVRSEPGVAYVEGINLFVDEVPDRGVRSVTQDQFQPRTWYAASGEKLFRTLDDGLGWEAAGRFPGEEVALVRVHPGTPGILAVATHSKEKGGAGLYGSWDCGETWKPLARTAFRVDDMAWTTRDGVPVLLLAAEVGLYEVALRSDRERHWREPTPVQVLVDPKDPDRGFWAVAVAMETGGTTVAAAARGTGGVYLSNEGGRSQTYRHVGLKGEDVRVLAVEVDSPRSFLWAGIGAGGENDPGKGCFRIELMGREDAAEGWRKFGKGWKGGSVKSLAFQGPRVLAATFSAGVLSLARTEADPAWQAPDFVSSRLPLRDQGRLQVVEDIAVDPDQRLIFAGGPEGVFVSEDQGKTYAKRSDHRFETVTLPVTWLFCSGEHKITVVSEDEAGRR